jgi:hypothetical protein
MHRVLSARTSSMSRQIDDRGAFVTSKETELDKLPFSARTPRVTTRANTQLDSKVKPKEIRAGPTRTSTKTSFAQDPRQPIRDLMEESLHSTQIKKKDDAIQHLGSLLIHQTLQAESLETDKERFSQEIHKLKADIERLHRQSDKQVRTSSKLQELRHLKTIRDDTLVPEIERIETEIQKFVHLSEPWLLRDITNGDPDQKIEGLINLKFRRLEDLVYGFWRQLLADREVVECIPFVVEKFGSVRNLIAKHDEALNTIDRLNVREFKYSGNELIKRRQLAKCDVPTLHLLIIALQNELIEAMAQLRSISLALGGRGHICCPDVLTENPIDFDLISHYNLLEANHNELQARYDNLRKDYDLLASQVSLDKDITTYGPFRIGDQIKEKLKDANTRILGYQENLNELQHRIDLQQQLVIQFQREKDMALRHKFSMMSQVSQLREKVTECEGEVRTVHRQLDSVRGLARLMAENTLRRRKYGIQKSFEFVSNSFFASFERYDSAALVIQRAWRRQKTPEFEKKVVRGPCPFPANEVMVMSAMDAVLGKLPPMTYDDIVQMLKTYNGDLRNSIQVPLALMQTNLSQVHEYVSHACERVLCRGKRFAWTQVEIVHRSVDVQTEATTRGRTGRRP